MKKLTLILLSSLMLISLISCDKESDKEEISTNAEVSDTTVKEDATENKEEITPTDNQDLSKFSITSNLAENTKVAYSTGTYAEADRAYDLYRKYLIDGLDSVSSQLIYSDLDEEYNFVLVAPTDKYLKDLQLYRESMLNQISGKVVKVTPTEIEYSRALKANEEDNDAIDIQIHVIVEVDSGDKYNDLAYVTVFEDKGVLKYQIRP